MLLIPAKDSVTAKRWEGKPLSFKLKYLWANYPSIAITCGIFLTVVPTIIGIRLYLANLYGVRKDVVAKYKHSYKVVREDDENIEKIIQQKEAYRNLFPEFL